jgi:DNA-directed RNA polymerase subunit M/transcription elongation factor TFIIS
MTRERRYIHEEQQDCPKCGKTLHHQGTGQTGDVEYRACRWCETTFAVAPGALDRDVVESRYRKFLEELAEHAEQVRSGEAEPGRLRQWAERCAEEWCLPLQPAAVEAIVVAATGREPRQESHKNNNSKEGAENE